jgi:hypothetical protein
MQTNTTRVFRHKCGFILDYKGDIVHTIPDSAGWYFWLEGQGYWYLSGPYDTEEDALFYQEALMI